MPSRKSRSRYKTLIALSASAFISCFGLTPTISAQRSQLFQAYFDALAAEPHTPQRRNANAATLRQLQEAIPEMTTADLQQAVKIIDTAVDRARITHDGIARTWAGMLLYSISTTKDGPDLLAPEISHLSAVCSDPFLMTGSLNMFVLLQSRYPELTVASMLQAIKSVDANSPDGKGPAYATILLLLPRNMDVEKDVLIYMQRPDLTGDKLLEFLKGIQAASSMSDAVVEQLTHFLNDPRPEIRLAALRDISRGGFAERERLRPILRRFAGDPAESDALRTLAEQTLATNKLVYLDPYQ